MEKNGKKNLIICILSLACIWSISSRQSIIRKADNWVNTNKTEKAELENKNHQLRAENAAFQEKINGLESECNGLKTALDISQYWLSKLLRQEAEKNAKPAESSAPSDTKVNDGGNKPSGNDGSSSEIKSGSGCMIKTIPYNVHGWIENEGANVRV